MHILYSVSLISRNGTTEQNKWWYYTPRIIISFHHLHVPKKLNLNANRHTIKTWKCKACTQLHFRLINIPLICFKKVVCHFITISCSYSNVPVSEQNQNSSLQVNVKREAILKHGFLNDHRFYKGFISPSAHLIFFSVNVNRIMVWKINTCLSKCQFKTIYMKCIFRKCITIIRSFLLISWTYISKIYKNSAYMTIENLKVNDTIS